MLKVNSSSAGFELSSRQSLASRRVRRSYRTDDSALNGRRHNPKSM